MGLPGAKLVFLRGREEPVRYDSLKLGSVYRFPERSEWMRVISPPVEDPDGSITAPSEIYMGPV